MENGEKMSKQPIYKRFKYTLAIGAHMPIHQVGDLVSLLDANDTLEVAFGDGDFVEMNPGQTISFQGEEFSDISIRNTSGAVNNVDLYVGRGEFFDLRFAAQGTLNTRPDMPDVFTTGDPISALDVATTALAAANVQRRELLLINSGAATVYIGGNAAATAGQGLPLLAGAAMTLDNGAAIYARNDSGAAVAVAVAESEWAV